MATHQPASGQVYFKLLAALLIVGSVLGTFSSALALTDNQAASGLIGQYSNTSGTTPAYTKAGTDNGPSAFGFSFPADVEMDTVNHHLFVSDANNSRVLVYTLTTGNELADYIPDYVLGQPDFATNTAANTQSGLNSTRGIAFDSDRSYLFVTEASGNRVKVFDLSGGITSGMNASYVLGQSNFSSSTAANTQSGLSNPHGVHFDPVRDYLYVAERNGHRVKVFDVASITSGEDAIAVIGQSSFTAATAAHTQTGIHTPTDVAMDDTGNILFVNEFGGNRVKVFDVTTLATSSQSAINVIGQSLFTTATAANTQSGLNAPHGIFYDNTNDRLFVAEWSGNRVKVFNLSGGITDGMNASNVLGQSTFTDAVVGNSQSGIYRSIGLYLNETTNDLYVAEWEPHRIKIFDVAAITDGENAVGLIGQYDGSSLSALSPAYDKSSAHNGPNLLGLNTPSDVEVDTVNHRLFISDSINSRVLVHTLNASNVLTDNIPDYVIGQPNFATSTATNTQAGLNIPRGLAFDQDRNWLFVGEASGNKVKIFDLSGGITNGMNASYVLGQSTFTAGTATNTQSGLNSPWGIHFDPVRKYLYVAERSGHRVKVFDVDSITNGEDAIAVIGQASFTTATAANTQIGIREPMDIDVDNTGNIVYIAEFSGHRVKTYDVTSLASTSQPAVNVIGQSLFTTATAANTQSGLNGAIAVRYDDNAERLYVAEYNSNKIKAYDLSSGITDGMAASNLLGQALYTDTAAANTQTGVSGIHAIHFDATSGLLYAVEGVGNRVKMFEVSTPTGGGGGGGGGGGDSGGGGFSTVTVITGPDVTTVASNGQPWYILSAATTTATSTATSSVSATSTATSTSATSTTPGATSTTPQLQNLFPFGKPDYTFARTLTVNSRNDEVRRLQQFLNMMGYAVSKSGAGSSGRETTYFGPATRAALAKFQKAVGIKPAAGYFGPITRAFLNNLK